MTNKYTKDDLVEKIINLSEKNIIAFQELKGAIVQLNEQGKLHTHILEKNTLQANENGDSVQNLVKQNSTLYKIIIILLAIVAVAAGAEQILKLGLFQ